MTSDVRLPAVGLLTVYGVDTCEDTTRARTHLDAAGLTYRYVNYDLDPAAKALVHAAGYMHTPVVALPDGSLFMEPTDAELATIVMSAGTARFGGRLADMGQAAGPSAGATETQELWRR